MSEKMNDVKQMNYHALMILQCLFEHTDQYKHLSLKEIEKIIRDRYGDGPSHNHINKILHYLPDYGFDVRKGTRANPGFYLNSRYFTEGEILFIIESLKKTKALPIEARNEFTYKLNKYLGPEYADLNERQFIRKKRRDKELTEKIAIIDNAIRTEKQLWFDITAVKEEMGSEIARKLCSPYKVFEREGEIIMLYGSDDGDGGYSLSQRKVKDISNFWIDPDYKAVPIFKAKNYQYVNDELLSRVDFIHPTAYLNHHLLVRIKSATVSRDNKRKESIKNHFGSKNVIFFDIEHKEYCYIRNIYGDGEEWFFRHPDVATVVWPMDAVKRIKGKIAKLYNKYYPDNEPLEEKFKFVRNSEEQCLESEADTFAQIKEKLEEIRKEKQ